CQHAAKMNTDHPLDRYLARYPAVAVVGYVAALAVLAFISWSAAAGIYERHAALASATGLLEQVEGRKQTPGSTAASFGTAPAGSPFLEGETVTVAGATLQHRVATAVTKLGGGVLSSQVELQGTQSKEGFVSLIVSCEIDQPALQQLLYDLEAGMPFLF